MNREINGQHALRVVSQGQSTQAISDAMSTLNRLGYVVGVDGCITIEDQKVRLQVQGGALVALVGGAVIPWRLFRQALKPRSPTA